MARLRIDLQYDGTDFHGWQTQPNATSVQQTIEYALSKLNSNIPTEIVGCGRTDTGVHAKHYVAHCDFEYENLDELILKMNHMLPPSIHIFEVVAAHNSFHARFDAKKRSYRYFIDKTKNPFNNKFAHYSRQILNIDAMNEAAIFLIGRHDFESFAKHHSDVNNHFCEVFKAFWSESDEQYIFEISANRFLRNMVRAIVGTLADIGLGKIEPTQIQDIISKKNRSEAGTSVPGKGLFLWEIEY